MYPNQVIMNANRGTGAGGANTNVSGKSFEARMSMQSKLIDSGYTKTITDKACKFGYSLSKTIDNKIEINYVKQIGLKKYLHFEHSNKDLLLDELNHPDECFIIQDKSRSPFFFKPKLIVIEMKNQNVSGSCFDKLYNGMYYKCLYDKLIGKYYDVEYHFVVSEFIEKKINSKPMLKQILNENNIKIFNARDYHTAILTYIDCVISTF